MLADDRALAYLDPRGFGVKDRAVHHPGARTDANVPDEGGGRGDKRRRVDNRLMTAMADQHGDSLRRTGQGRRAPPFQGADLASNDLTAPLYVNSGARVGGDGQPPGAGRPRWRASA